MGMPFEATKKSTQKTLEEMFLIKEVPSQTLLNNEIGLL
jgi:hypothetical protein